MASIASDKYPWLTAQFFENILNANGHKHARIVDFELNEAVGKGENYGSHMIRAMLNFSDDAAASNLRKSFVIKTALTSESFDHSKVIEVFAREIAFYRDILPKFQKYKEILDGDFKCAPRCYAVSDDPIYLVLEDLKIENFHNADRRRGLDFSATEILVRKLAKLHAINAMVYEDAAHLFNNHKKGLISQENADLIALIARGMRDCQGICTTWPGYEHFAEKLKQFGDNILPLMDNVYTCSDKTFKTLTHGDLWVNNIMYKFADEEATIPIDVIMVDYQIGYYGSPAIDLSYLFYTSTVNEIGEREWDRLIQIYHAELVVALNSIGYEKRVPTLTELHVEILQRSALAVLMSFNVFRYMESGENANIETMFGDSEIAMKIRQALFDRPIVKERIQYLLDYYDRKGFLEC